MRLEFALGIDKVDVPRFAVEAVEGIGKIFTLATLVLNVLDSREKVEIVFHGLNPEDPGRKIVGFKEIIGSCRTSRAINFSEGEAGRVPGSSSSYQWLTISRA